MKKQRLVSAPSLMEHVKEYHEHIKQVRNPRATKQNLAQDAIILDCIGIIESEPTVDVVEVIRCCNCQYWNSKNCGCNCPEIDVRDLEYMQGDMKTESNHFCGYGKRRTIHDGNNK